MLHPDRSWKVDKDLSGRVYMDHSVKRGSSLARKDLDSGLDDHKVASDRIIFRL